MSKRWSIIEIEFLINNYEIMSYSKIANILGKTIKAIESKLYKLNLRLSEQEKHKRLRINGQNQIMDSNPNWKGGISENHYHYKKLQIKRYPEKVKARELLNIAISNGRIKRKNCIICGNPNTQGHHEDYSKPLT